MKKQKDKLKQSRESGQQGQDQDQQCNQNQKQKQEECNVAFSPFTLPKHLMNTEEIRKICEESKKKLLQSGRFTWDELFQSNMNVQVIDTNFEWMRVMLHYGHFKLEVLVLYTEIDQRVFEEVNLKSGGFGVVRFLSFQQARYAVKGVKIDHKQNEIDIDNAYREYFLCSITGILETGPKILPLFGYDILLTKETAFFAMEECAPIRLEYEETISFELLKNLKTMHSVRFIHNDIKPENIAYSLQLNKHIFIDFGLSKLIKDEPGHKTRTSFAGTLSYCSEEMKKCYFLKKSTYVDLYENDAWCLQKSIRTLKYVKNASSFSQELELSEKVTKQFSIFQQIVYIVRLKYFIYKQNIKQILQNLTSIKSPRTLHGILTSPSIPLIISTNKIINQKLQLIKNEMHLTQSQLNTLSSMDAVLFQFFSQEKLAMSAEKIIPITQILASQSQLFNRYLEKPELVQKLLYFFQPFSNGKGCGGSGNKCQMMKKIVEKIYEVKNSSRSPIFFAEKVLFAVTYIYQTIKPKPNLKSLLSLRIISISLEHWQVVDQLQHLIVDTIEKSFLLLLKIVEFVLFRSCFLWNFKEVDEKWVGLVTRLRGNFGGRFGYKVMELFQVILSSRIRPNFHELMSKHKKQMLNEINQITQQCQSGFEKSSICNIKYFFLFICKSQQGQFQQFCNNLQTRIYKRCWNPQSYQVTGLQQQQQQQKMLWPVLFQYRSYLQHSQASSQSRKNEMTAMIRNQFQLLKQRDEIVVYIIHQILSMNYYEKGHLYFFIARIQEFLGSRLEIKSTQGDKNQDVWDLGVQQRIACVNFFIQMLLRNQKYAEQSEKIENHSKMQLLNQL